MGEAGMMTSCKQVARLLTSGELERSGFWTRLRVRLHLWMCRHCSRLARQLEQIRSAARRLRATFDAEKPAAGEEGLEARLLKKLQRRDET
jgi:hypothetical protein